MPLSKIPLYQKLDPTGEYDIQVLDQAGNPFVLFTVFGDQHLTSPRTIIWPPKPRAPDSRTRVLTLDGLEEEQKVVIQKERPDGKLEEYLIVYWGGFDTDGRVRATIVWPPKNLPNA